MVTIFGTSELYYGTLAQYVSKEKVSILDDVDFEVELIHRDEINVRYILELLRIYFGKGDAEQQRIRKQISDLLNFVDVFIRGVGEY